MKRCPQCGEKTYPPDPKDIAAALESDVRDAMKGDPAAGIEPREAHYAIGFLGASVANAIPRLLGLCPPCRGKKFREVMVILGIATEPEQRAVEAAS